jgi:VWFA-related protein
MPLRLRGLTAGVLLAACALMIPLRAQQTVFKSGVELVRFDLSVFDDSGTPIADLRPDELEIVEDGRVLPLVLFQHIQEPAGRYTEAAVRAVSAEVSTNTGMPRGHLYILLFDQQHIAPGNEQPARRAAEQFIRAHVRPTDRIAIFGLPGPGPDIAFTADAKHAISELQKVRGQLQRVTDTPVGTMSVEEAYEIAGGDAALLSRVIERQSEELSSDVAAGGAGAARGAADTARVNPFSADDPATTRRVVTENARTIVQHEDATTRDFLLRLSDLMMQFRAIEGRKSLVLFSEGFHDENVTRELQNVAAAAAESYSVFYAMDLNRRRSDLSDAAAPSTVQATEIQRRVAPLGSLAAETDGVLVNDATAQIDTALARIANRSQDYYLVGFVPSDAALAARGSYRRVSVRVRRAGARVSARTGYSVPRAAGSLDRRRAIDAALAAPFVHQALKVDYTTYLLRSDASGQPKVVLSLAAELPVAGDNHTTADVVFVARDVRDGRVVASGTGTMAMPETPDVGGSLGRSVYRVQFEVPAGKYLMRAVVREPGGLMGSADRQLEVRPLPGPGVSASDLVLGSAKGLPVRAEAYAQDGLGGLLEIYGHTAEQLSNVSVLASLVTLSGDEQARTIDAALSAPEPSGTVLVRRASFDLPLTGLAPGPYVARVRVRADGEDVAQLSREVEVRAGSGPALASASAPAAPAPTDVIGGDVFRRARAALEGSSAPAAARATKGLDLFAQADYRGAASELQAAFDADPHSAETAFVLGWAWEGAGDARRAISAWRASAAIDPHLVPAHLALADAYLHLSERALAVQALRAGLDALPDSVELQNKLAEIEKR